MARFRGRSLRWSLATMAHIFRSFELANLHRLRVGVKFCLIKFILIYLLTCEHHKFTNRALTDDPPPDDWLDCFAINRSSSIKIDETVNKKKKRNNWQVARKLAYKFISDGVNQKASVCYSNLKYAKHQTPMKQNFPIVQEPVKKLILINSPKQCCKKNKSELSFVQLKPK